MPSRHSGNQAEKLAREHMIAAGLRCIASNYRCRFGELDLVMEDAATLVITEVRYRAAAVPATAVETVNRKKCRKIALATLHFLQRYKQSSHRPVRFDVVALSGSLDSPQIEWIRDAFSADDVFP